MRFLKREKSRQEMTDGSHRLRTVFYACRREVAAILLFSTGTNLLLLTLPLYTLNLFDHVLTSYHLPTLFYLTLIALVALTGMAGLDAARLRLARLMAARVDHLLAGEVLNSQIRLLPGMGGQPGGQALRDVETIRNSLSEQGFLTLLDLPWTPIYIFIVSLFSLYLGGVLLIGALILLLLATANRLIQEGPVKRMGQHAIARGEASEALLRGHEPILAMGMLTQVLTRWGGLSADYHREGEIVAWRSAVMEAISRFIRSALQIAIMGVGAWLVLDNALTSGGMVVVSMLAARALAPLDGAIRVWKNLQLSLAAGQRLALVLGAAPPLTTAMPLPVPRGELAVEKLTFAYPGSQEALIKGITFRIKAGESVGIIGPSASGKSTLLKLLLGILTPTAGAVRLDGANVAVWDRDDLGQHLGYLPQEVVLIPGSIRENIARFQEAPPEAIVTAAERAGVHAMILLLPQGYETRIGGAGGIVLSGGQRQRIGLARALFGLPRLLLLDEPNAHLDGEGEIALMRAMGQAKAAGVTVVMVAHRPSLLAHADTLIVLKEGRIDRLGPRAEVLPNLINPGRGTDPGRLGPPMGIR